MLLLFCFALLLESNHDFGRRRRRQRRRRRTPQEWINMKRLNFHRYEVLFMVGWWFSDHRALTPARADWSALPATPPSEGQTTGEVARCLLLKNCASSGAGSSQAKTRANNRWGSTTTALLMVGSAFGAGHCSRPGGGKPRRRRFKTWVPPLEGLPRQFSARSLRQYVAYFPQRQQK